MLRPFSDSVDYMVQSRSARKGSSIKEDEDVGNRLVLNPYMVYELLLVPQDPFMLWAVISS